MMTFSTHTSQYGPSQIRSKSKRSHPDYTPNFRGTPEATVYLSNDSVWRSLPVNYAISRERNKIYKVGFTASSSNQDNPITLIYYFKVIVDENETTQVSNFDF